VIISDLDYLEEVSEAPIIGGKKRRKNGYRRQKRRLGRAGVEGGRGNSAIAHQCNTIVQYITIGNNNTGNIIPVANGINTSNSEQTALVPDVITTL